MYVILSMTCYVLWYYNNAIFHTVSYHYILHKLFSISFDHFSYSFNLWFEIHAFTLVCRIKMRATCMCYLIMEVPSSGLLQWCTACLVVLLPWVADLNAGAGCLVAGVPGGLSASNTLPGYLQAASIPVWFLTRRMDRGARHDPLQRLGHQG